MPLRLLQLTDLHLFGDSSGQLLGMTTRDSFEAVLELALSSSPPAGALILSGDLVHDETPAGYRYLRETLKRTELPHFCVAGNHDDLALMDTYLGSAAVGPVALRRLDDWNLVFLDSSVPGSDGGHLTEAQMNQLSDLLAGNSAPTMIFLHHHPVPIQSAWMDTMGVDNGTELMELCEQHPQVKAILFGHVHQAFMVRHGGCSVLGTPSTCFQFLPGSKDFAIDTSPPGYRELLLYPDGHFTTEIVRLDQYAEQPLHQAEGY
ncbi:metallophosphoesterase [Thiocystis violacea]|uniref:metallophosphoesterase n=1 Tax=Thiocystis violacea TaxID=13725 RepID=UPI001906E2DC|nr:metallophosphoesterase [Thiocystis violacea]MBK1723793.1 phosphoesterase [Thiocystis violacea]